jgi:2-polyprenyl-3-methyl-5-hydroxy-6-metoxy-1,4-benzoquinol methylase
MEFFCPKGRQGSNCTWKPRRGRVRDYPNIGIRECNDCGLVTHNEDLSDFVEYSDGTMHNWSKGYSSRLPKPNDDVLRRHEALLHLSSIWNIKRILDWGCGAGAMIRNLMCDFEVSGLEPDNLIRFELLAEGIRVFANHQEAIESNLKYDCVTLFHVVEHLYDSVGELKLVREMLRPDGLLVIETPNSNDALLKLYKNIDFENFTYWSHHPMLHSKQSLRAAVENSGFEIISLTGVQRYGFANHLYWLTKGKPGGHEKIQGRMITSVSKLYSKMLVTLGFADTLWLVAKVK